MAILLTGNGGVVAEVDGTQFRAIRMTPRPVDNGALGAFSYGGFTGILPAALAANSEIFQFRWTHATNFAVIRKIRFSSSVSTTFFAAGVPLATDLVRVGAWTAPGTGGTAITPVATMKARSSMASSSLVAGDARIATTAALGAGTKTIEANALSSIVAGGPITASLAPEIVAPGTILWQAEVGDGEHPLVLATNEGFIIRSVAVPATGTWTAAISVSWAECTAY